MLRITWLILVGLLLPISSQAASFDCSKAKSSLEKLICSNPKISGLDDDLAKSYVEAMKLLSDDGKAILKKGQSDWLRHLNLVCIKFNKTNDRFNTPSGCIEKKYVVRIKDLQTAAIRIGPFLFSRIDYFYSKEDANSGRPYDGQTSYPRIDSPQSDTAKKWNAMMAKSSKADGDDWCDGSPGDVKVYFEIKLATENTISAQVGSWTYCHGAAHGMGGSKSAIYILNPEPHLMVASDLFDQTEPWEEFLTNKCLTVLKAKAKGTDINEGMVQGIGTDPEAWSLTKNGLLITFNPYEVLAYAFGTTEVLIPWSELEPFIVSPELIPK